MPVVQWQITRPIVCWMYACVFNSYWLNEEMLVTSHKTMFVAHLFFYVLPLFLTTFTLPLSLALCLNRIYFVYLPIHCLLPCFLNIIYLKLFLLLLHLLLFFGTILSSLSNNLDTNKWKIFCLLFMLYICMCACVMKWWKWHADIPKIEVQITVENCNLDRKVNTSNSQCAWNFWECTLFKSSRINSFDVTNMALNLRFLCWVISLNISILLFFSFFIFCLTHCFLMHVLLWARVQAAVDQQFKL